MVKEIIIKIGDPKYDVLKQGKVVSQSTKEGTSLYDMIDTVFEVEIMEVSEEKPDVPDEETEVGVTDPNSSESSNS